MIEAYKSTIKSKIENCVNSTYNKKILDVDCGDMDRTKLFCRNGNNVISIYIERPENMKGALRLVIVDGQYLPFTSNSFDLVVSFGVIEHVSDDSVFLSEVRIVLKRGGKILFRTPNKNRFSHRFLKVLGKEVEYPLRLEGGCIHLWEYTYEQLTSIFKKEDLRILMCIQLGWNYVLHHYGISKVSLLLSNYVQYWLSRRSNERR